MTHLLHFGAVPDSVCCSMRLRIKPTIPKKDLDSIGGLGDGCNKALTRGDPDIAALGYNVGIVVDGQTRTIGGSSVSSPIVVAPIALLNNDRHQKDQGPMGWMNPRLYSNPSTLTDITTGNTAGQFGNDTKYFPAKKGWDLASGLGSPKFQAWQQVFTN